jgi:ATP-dependent Lon protease
VYATLPSLLLILSSSREGKLDADYIAVNFYVDDIKPINWNDDAYDHLVYQEEQKDLVLTFVDNHKRLKHGVDDVIVGKGQGIIMLLSGPPGTGKTLTAEAGEFFTGRI